MKNIKILLYAFLIVFSFNSCELMEDSTIDGNDLTASPKIIGWSQPIITESYFEDLGIIDKNYTIDILGGGDGSPTTQDIEMSLSINVEETTAINGEYVLDNLSATIPAGSSFGTLPIGINTPNFSPDNPTKLVLDIVSTVDGVAISTVHQKLIVNFVGCLSTLDQHTYNVVIHRAETGSETSINGVSLTALSVNNFQTANVGHWPLEPGVRFEEICGKLYIKSHDLADMYSNQVTALGSDNLAGEVDENGNFVLKYNISPSGSTIWGDYTATYTKQ